MNTHFHKLAGEQGEAIIADDGVKFEVGEGTRCINCHNAGTVLYGCGLPK